MDVAQKNTKVILYNQFNKPSALQFMNYPLSIFRSTIKYSFGELLIQKTNLNKYLQSFKETKYIYTFG